MIKQTIQKLLRYVLGTKQGEALSLLTEIMIEKEAQGRYLGLCDILENLGISPAEWSDIRNGKKEVLIVKKKHV